MTQKEALAYLGEDWEDTFEEEIFALKQQILTLIPIQKLYQAKIDKCEKLEEAFVFLGGRLASENSFAVKDFTFSDVILEAFQNYQQYKNQLKLNITQVNTSNLLKIVCDSLIKLEVEYANLWSLSNSVDKVVLSNQPDPMDLLQAIKRFNELKGYTFSDLKEMINVAPKVLVEEQKRLTLYATKYGKL